MIAWARETQSIDSKILSFVFTYSVYQKRYWALYIFIPTL